MVKLLDKYVINVIVVTALVVAVLLGVLGEKRGVAATGKMVEVAGTAFGATIGLIPRFFDSVSTGLTLTVPKDKPKAKAGA